VFSLLRGYTLPPRSLVCLYIHQEEKSICESKLDFFFFASHVTALIESLELDSQKQIAMRETTLKHSRASRNVQCNR
jgi:hypothetical protein